ncbi:MAG: hypothetical protein JXA20_03515 [Spirochaetes bacterium]|nr:hypothetical protein [Spirochaetota bacterium]
MDSDIRITTEEVERIVGRLPQGGRLPQEGPCTILYTKVYSPGDAIVLRGKRGYAVLFFDLEEELQSLETGRCGWHVESQGFRTTVTMIFTQRGEPQAVNLSMHHSLEDNVRFLEFLKKKRRLTVYFLSISGGEIRKFSSGNYRLPKELAASIAV